MVYLNGCTLVMRETIAASVAKIKTKKEGMFQSSYHFKMIEYTKQMAF